MARAEMLLKRSRTRLRSSRTDVQPANEGNIAPQNLGMTSEDAGQLPAPKDARRPLRILRPKPTRMYSTNLLPMTLYPLLPLSRPQGLVRSGIEVPRPKPTRMYSTTLLPMTLYPLLPNSRPQRSSMGIPKHGRTRIQLCAMTILSLLKQISKHCGHCVQA